MKDSSIELGESFFMRRRRGGEAVFGLIKWREAGAHGGAEFRRIDGVRFLVVRVQRGGGIRTGWSVRRAARILRKNGVTEAVFPRDFPDAAHFAARGIAPVDVRPLREEAAASLIRCALAQREIAPQRATVALCASRVTRAYMAAAEQLASDTRYLQICAGEGAWELSLALLGRFGAAAPVLRAPEGADIALCFDDGSAVCSAACVLPLRSPTLRIQYAGMETCVEEPEQFLAARYASLTLRAEEIACTSYSME